MRATALSAVLLWPGLALAQTCPVSAEPAPAAEAPARVERAAENRDVYPVIGAAEIARFPALRRIASNGATLLDMGTVEGLRLVFAYKGDHMEVFHILPSGRHAVRSGRLLDLAEPDPAKRDLTIARAARIPGVIPSVRMTGEAAQAAATAVDAGDGEAVMAKLDASSFGTIGPATAPRLWMIFDPLCPYSKKAIEQLRPLAAAGKVQVALIPVPMLDRAPENRSSALVEQLLSGEPQNLDGGWAGALAGRTLPGATPQGQERMRGNVTLAAAIGVRNSPTFAWRDGSGAPQAQEGAQGIDGVVAGLGQPR